MEHCLTLVENGPANQHIRRGQRRRDIQDDQPVPLAQARHAHVPGQLQFVQRQALDVVLVCIMNVRSPIVIAYQQLVVNRDVPSVIEIRIKVQVEHVERPDYRRRPCVHCLACLFPRELEGPVFNRGVASIEQLR